MFSVKNKVILITGSTRGIGKTLAIEFKKKGATVIIHGRSETNCKKIAETIQCDFVSGDLSNELDVKKMAKTITMKYEKLDVLINNAGIEKHKKISEMDMNLYDSIQNVCVRSQYLLTSLLYPLLCNSDHGASIINMSSIHQLVPVKSNSPYCMAKASMEMFSKVASLEFSKDNIRVNTLAPGAIKTDMNFEVIEAMGENNFKEWIPLGRVGKTNEIFGPALFLASSASSYVTGTTLYVDGGYIQNLLRYEV